LDRILKLFSPIPKERQFYVMEKAKVLAGITRVLPRRQWDFESVGQ
jgi:hypothetical protein